MSRALATGSLGLLLLVGASVEAKETSIRERFLRLGASFVRQLDGGSNDTCDIEFSDFLDCTFTYLDECSACDPKPVPNAKVGEDCDMLQGFYNANKNCCTNDNCGEKLEAFKECKACGEGSPTEAPPTGIPATLAPPTSVPGTGGPPTPASSTCPSIPPDTGDSCVGFENNLTCEFGEECCCGQCFPSLICECSGGQWGCFFSDACLAPCPTDSPTEASPTEAPPTPAGTEPEPTPSAPVPTPEGGGGEPTPSGVCPSDLVRIPRAMLLKREPMLEMSGLRSVLNSLQKEE